MSKVILITGLPCSGKTTLARQVSAALACPTLSKDDFKERLADNEGQTPQSRLLGIQAEEMMLAASLDLARANTTHVAESVLRAEYISAYLRDVSAIAQLLVVVLQCEREVLMQRFRQRSRHVIHNDAEFVATMPTMQDINVDAFRNYAVEVMEFETSELSEAKVREYAAIVVNRYTKQYENSRL